MEVVTAPYLGHFDLYFLKYFTAMLNKPARIVSIDALHWTFWVNVYFMSARNNWKPTCPNVFDAGLFNLVGGVSALVGVHKPWCGW